AILIDTDFHSTEPDRLSKPQSESDTKSQPITIGDSVWICGQSAILKGVSIGDNSIVGFRAVVTKNVPPNIVVAGNPARIVKRMDPK
ncbi:MAG: acyltransferase, partial [Patescibacteria group bacterium]|nr:acyltransferase [Patescibacteria group bacterium]